MARKLSILSFLRHDLLLWFFRLLTDWMPDVGPVLKLRGLLFSLCFKNCGIGFTVGRDVTILVPSKLVVGDHVYFAKGTWINAFGGVVIENEVMLSPYVIVASSQHGFKDGSVFIGGTHASPIRIGRGSWLASHVVVSAGVTIGSGNMIGANAVVTKNTPENAFAGGVPAKIIGQRVDNPSDVFGRDD